ncbi:pilus assembly PilX family protein [Paraherbaspirillum soli]|uniref:PilX N-terminal domain-containing pilus assembly protein n=1 Tax=Paraherbaspirillum soli TaxID=631222 RepID=A0ABW0M3J5_9BURK
MVKTKHSHSGIALPIVLIFLVVMMLIGAVAIRNVTLDEKMAGNSRNQQLAFQAAERALRYCENAIQGTVPAGGAKPTVKNPAAPTDPNLWEVADNWTGSKAIAVTIPSGSWTINSKTFNDGLASEPQCMVEDVGTTLKLAPTQAKRDFTTKVYRITARGVGATTDAVALLQSYLKF